MNRSPLTLARVALVALAAIGAGSAARAGQINGTQAIVDLGSPTADNADLSLATVFTLEDLTSAGGNTGDFDANNLQGQSLGSATLDLSNPGSFSFGSAAFGFFTATSIQALPSAAGVRNFYILGKFTPGTLFPSTLQDISDASFTLGFTQNNGGAISASGTLSSPPAFVPEPSTAVAMASGLAFAGMLALRRTRRS